MPPTLKQLRYLVAVADTLHFRRAAELSHVSQPTLSGQLRELEQRLGAQLVERSRTRVVLTPLGKEITARARLILREVQDLQDVARQGASLFGGMLRLGTLPTLGPYLLPHVLPELHRRYPQLRLYVREGMPQTLRGDLEDGKLDLLIFPLPAAGADLRSLPLLREPLLVAAARDHPLAGKAWIERADLKDQTVLALERGHRLRDQVQALCEDFGARLALDYEGTSLDTLRQMVGMGMGISFLPALYVRSEIPKDSDVVTRPLRRKPPSRTIGLVWRRQSARGGDYAALAAALRAILRGKVPEITVLG
ncbi:MAG: hydrogen peroxide-inducible genes activator [Kiloniellaceae bacterium]